METRHTIAALLVGAFLSSVVSHAYGPLLAHVLPAHDVPACTETPR